MDQFAEIVIDGSDTDAALNVAKRIAIIRKHLPGERCDFLDCGCGAGGYILALNAVSGVRAFGLEFEESKVAAAHRRGLDPARVIRGDIQGMPYPDSSFDVVMLNEVLEHVPDQKAGLDEVYRVLKPGGSLLVFSPNRCYPFETHGVYFKSSGKRLPFHTPFIPWLPLRIVGLWFKCPARNYWPSQLRHVLTSCGFVHQEHSYVWQTFENISGIQPRWMIRSRRLLRGLSRMMEKTPLLRRMGISQFVAVQKPVDKI